MFERFTDRARRVVVLAQEEARLLNHNYIGTEHILLGLIHEGEGVAAKALESLGISLEAVRSQVEEIIGQGGSSPSGHIPFTPRAKKVLELSLREALQLGHNYIGTEHILLGLIREGEGVAAQVLVKLGADLSRVRQQVIQLLSGYQGPGGRRSRREGRPPPPAAASGASPPARSCSTSSAATSPSWPARRSSTRSSAAREIERVMQVLSRRTKNNPVLIGEPGVGKTAIVEGLAQTIVAGDVPETLKGKQLYTLDLGALVAGPLPRRLRGAPQEGAEGDPHPRRHHPVHRRAPHPRRVPAPPRAPSTPPRSSSRCWPAASCRPSAPPRSTSTASTSRRTPPSSAASSRSRSTSPPSPTRSRS